MFLHSHQSFAVNDTCIMPSAFAPDFVLHYLLLPPPPPPPSRSVVCVGVCVCGGGAFVYLTGGIVMARLFFFYISSYITLLCASDLVYVSVFLVCIYTYSYICIYTYTYASKWTLYKFPREPRPRSSQPCSLVTALIQTQKRFKRTPCIRTRTQLQMFGLIPFVKLQKDT